MKKLVLAIGVIFLSGCHLEKPNQHNLEVSIENNIPCFHIPSELISDKEEVRNRGAIISRKEGERWNTVWSSPTTSPLPVIVAEKCISYPQLKWDQGTWSVMLGISADNDSTRYRLEKSFSLQKDNSGHLSILYRLTTSFPGIAPVNAVAGISVGYGGRFLSSRYQFQP